VDGDFGQDVVSRLTSAQAEVFAKTSQTPLARQAARIGAKDAILGSYVSVLHLPGSSSFLQANGPSRGIPKYMQ
jgi:hypothetical protein